MKIFSYGSVCSGIEAVSVAWRDLAKPLWFSEIEPFPCALLQYHYPDVPNLGDMRHLVQKILSREISAPDVLIGGTPCQSYSYAGKRHSLNDERGGLMLTGLVGANQPLQPTGKRWTNSGYVCERRNIAWRVLDAQYFGLAQRRRRIFVIAGVGEQCSSKILFEPKSLHRHPASGRNEEPTLTVYIESSFGTYRQSDKGGTVKASGGVLSGGSETLIVHGTQDPIISRTVAHCLGRNNGWENILFEMKEVNPTVVRKLTVTECERLMGFPDHYTQIPYRNKPALYCPDTPRYKALANSMAVPVVRWIGHRLCSAINRTC